MPEGVGYKNVQLPGGEVVAFPGDMADDEIHKQIRRHLIGQMGEENANRLHGLEAQTARAPRNINLVRGPGGRGGVSMASGGPSPGVGAAAGVAGLVLPGAAFHPITTGMAAGRGYIAERLLKEAGAGPKTSASLGVLASLGPRAVLNLARGAITGFRIGGKKTAEKLAPKLFPETEAEALEFSAMLRRLGKTQAEIDALVAPVKKAAEKVAEKASPGAVRAAEHKAAQEVAAKESAKFADAVRKYQQQGFSEGQIVASLRQVHGFPTAKAARDFTRMVLGK